MSRIANRPTTEIPSYVLAILIVILQSSAQKIGLEAWLPTTATGWITTLGFIGLLGKEIWKRGQKEAVSEETVNAVGGRVTAVNAKVERLDGQFLEHQRTVDRILEGQKATLLAIGHAEKGAQQCRDDTERYTIEIGSKVDTLRREVVAEIHQARDDFGVRAGKLEVDIGVLTREVQLRAEFDKRDDRNQRG